MENNRPISVTSIIRRVFERVIRKHILDFLEYKNLICQAQHGFVSNRSTLTNLIYFYDKVTKSLDANVPYDVFTLILKKLLIK